jgi:hypothetical protein
MKIEEKINYLKENHSHEWISERQKTEDEISDKQPFVCVCGKLATGFHEMNCRKFQKLVDKLTAKKFSGILKNDTKTNG